MARTSAGNQLTQAHRRRQLGIRAATLREIVALWPAFDLDDIDGSWRTIETALVSLTLANRRVSAAVSADYFRAFRTVEGVPGSSIPRIARPPDRQLLTSTLRLLGPIGAKKNIDSATPDVAGLTLVRISGSVSRQVMNGGRETLTQSGQLDNRARGWRRITAADPCDFCAQVRDEGVHALDATFPAHDHCACEPEIAY
jgi:hypothetical protein